LTLTNPETACWAEKGEFHDQANNVFSSEKKPHTSKSFKAKKKAYMVWPPKGFCKQGGFLF
jgi:hypothetical protein